MRQSQLPGLCWQRYVDGANRAKNEVFNQCHLIPEELSCSCVRVVLSAKCKLHSMKTNTTTHINPSVLRCSGHYVSGCFELLFFIGDASSSSSSSWSVRSVFLLSTLPWGSCRNQPTYTQVEFVFVCLAVLLACSCRVLD